MYSTQPRILIALATYNERDNLGPLVREIRGGTGRRRARSRRQFARWDRAGCRCAGGSLPAHSCHPSRRQARPGDRDPGDDAFRHGKSLRSAGDDGRRPQPSSTLSAKPARRNGPGGRDDRLALHGGGRRRELASLAPPDEPGDRDDGAASSWASRHATPAATIAATASKPCGGPISTTCSPRAIRFSKKCCIAAISPAPASVKRRSSSRTARPANRRRT